MGNYVEIGGTIDSAGRRIPFMYAEGLRSNHDQLRAIARGVIGQAVGFDVSFAGNMRDGEIERARQFAAHPMQRVKTRTAAGILTGHLLHHEFRIGVDVESSRLEIKRTLKSFEKRSVFGDIVVVMANPFRNADHFAIRLGDHHANARRTRAAVGTAIDMGDQIRHLSSHLQHAARCSRRQDVQFDSSIAVSSLPQFCGNCCGKGGRA